MKKVIAMLLVASSAFWLFGCADNSKSNTTHTQTKEEEMAVCPSCNRTFPKSQLKKQMGAYYCEECLSEE